MNKIILAAALGATMLTAAASAQSPAADAPPPPPHMGMRGMGPDALMRADLNHDGVITRDEAAREAEQRFAAMDANHDGAVTRDERRAAMEERRAAAGDNADRAPRGDDGAGWRRRDGDRAGKGMSAADARERALRMFDRVDTNGNGQVDRNEIEAARLLMRARMSGGDMPPPPRDDQ